MWERTVADGRERLLVSSGEWLFTRPRWSSDGTHLAYLRRRAGARGTSLDAAVAVFVVDRGQERLLTHPGKDALVPSDWSPDGKMLLGGCPQGASRRVGTCLLDVRDSNVPDAAVRVLAADPSRHFYEQRFSPNQRWISFIAVSATDAAFRQSASCQQLAVRGRPSPMAGSTTTSRTGLLTGGPSISCRRVTGR